MSAWCFPRVRTNIMNVDFGHFALWSKTCHSLQCFDPESSYQNESQAGWRHAETSDAAREALIDSTLLIYKGQVETAFREQTAGHNALLLFVGLTLRMMEEQLMNAYNDITAKQKEVNNHFYFFLCSCVWTASSYSLYKAAWTKKWKIPQKPQCITSNLCPWYCYKKGKASGQKFPFQCPNFSRPSR